MERRNGEREGCIGREGRPEAEKRKGMRGREGQSDGGSAGVRWKGITERRAVRKRERDYLINKSPQ